MLETNKIYTRDELITMFGRSDNEALKRKLQRYGVEFTESGRGSSLELFISSIANPFKIYCISELGFTGGTDFTKLLHFYYYFFNDEEFSAMPDEVKENRMMLSEKSDVSRQTIAKYTKRLETKDLITKDTNDYIYYFAYKNTQRITEKAEYSEAWKEYWSTVKSGAFSGYAIEKMIQEYKGIARKQAIPKVNAIYLPEINYFNTLIMEQIEKEVA